MIQTTKNNEMKTLTQKIEDAINDTQHDDTQYTDDYDGFTHSTYSGLKDDVIEALYEEGYDDNVSQNIVNDFVFQMID